jgi:integrase
MKGRRAHIVTLSASAIDVLRTAEALRSSKSDALVFPGQGGKQLSDVSVAKPLKALAPAYTVHGFRATFRTWAQERMPTMPEPVAEAALAHEVPDAVVRAYARSSFVEMRRTLLEAWSDFCNGQTNVLRLVS